MFTLKKQFGQHRVYDTHDKATFRKFFERLFQQKDIEHLDESVCESLKGHDTVYHNKFYSTIKSDDEFKRIYCDMIRKIQKQFFPDEKILIYQSFPSIRIQFHNNVVVPPHKDSDHIGNHPLGERNFIIPITKMHGTNTVYVETEPDNNDFRPAELEIGDLFYFNGNTCTHFNKENQEDEIRISLDFRVMTFEDYRRYIMEDGVTLTNPLGRNAAKMYVGKYYQVYFVDEPEDEMLKWYTMTEPIPQFIPSFDAKEADACQEYMNSGGFVTEYRKTREFEQEICKLTGAKHCIATTSGTVSLILALKALGIGPGDKVVVPNYTMIATVNAVLYVGATPVVVDVNPYTFTLDYDTLKRVLDKNHKEWTEYRNPHRSGSSNIDEEEFETDTPSLIRAVIHVSLNNRAKDLTQIVDLCGKRDIDLIEDSCQSLGCEYSGLHFGLWGDVGCFSLSSPKIISTGQGGFLITNNDSIADSLRSFKNFGRIQDGIDKFSNIGLNAKFTDIQAVIGLEQLKKLPERIERKREIQRLYEEKCDWVLQGTHPEWFPWFIDAIVIGRRKDFVRWMKMHDIGVRKTYPFICDTGIHDDNVEYQLRNVNITERITTNGVFLPSSHSLTNEQIHHICNVIRMFKEFKINC